MKQRNWLIIRIWLALMVMAGSLVGTSAFAQGGTVVRVDPASTTAQINNSFTLAVKVDNVANLSAIELHLAFNPNVIEVTQMTNGGFVSADFVAQNIYDNTAGTLDYAVAQMNRPAAQGNGTLLTITFHAKANGTSNLALRATQASPTGLILSDLNGGGIQSAWSNGSVTIGTPSAATSTPITPAPSQPSATPVTPAPSLPSMTPLPNQSTSTPSPNQPTATPIPNQPTATPVPPAPSGAVLGTHVVRFWETLYCIGRAYKVSPWAIADKNGIWWPYLIFPNQTLVIPNVPWSSVPAGTTCPAQFSTNVPPITITPVPTAVNGATLTPTAIPAATATGVPGTCRYSYTVQRGDTLYRIGVRFGTSYTEIARVNNLSNPRLIYTGQQLCIP